MNNDIERFLDKQKRLKQYPSKKKIRLDVLDYLSHFFEDDKEYNEQEVNTILKNWHTFNDYAYLRRELVDYHFLIRSNDGAIYKKK